MLWLRCPHLNFFIANLEQQRYIIAALSEVWWNEWNLQKQVEQSDYHCQPHLAISCFVCMNFLCPSANIRTHMPQSVQVLFVPRDFVADVVPRLAPQFAVQVWHKLLVWQTFLKQEPQWMALILEACFYIPPWATVFRRRPSSATTVAVSYRNSSVSERRLRSKALACFAGSVHGTWQKLKVATALRVGARMRLRSL